MDDATNFSLTFDDGDPALRPTTQQISIRSAYYLLANIDEHPEALPMAYDIANEYLNATQDESNLPDGLAALRDEPASLSSLTEWLSQHPADCRRLWQGDDDAKSRRLAMHYFIQYAPTAFVDGCWLQCVLRVATAHTRAGAQMARLYEHQVRAYSERPGPHFVSEYRDLHRRLNVPLDDLSSRSFSESFELHDFAFEFPVFLMCISQFPRSYLPELLGLHLAWQYMGLASFGPNLIRGVRKLHSMPAADNDSTSATLVQQGCQLTLAAVNDMLDDESQGPVDDVWTRIWRGTAMLVGAYSKWIERGRKQAPSGPPDPRQQMIEVLCRKAPHAHGYHGNKRIGDELIDEQFEPATFNPSGFLDKLAKSKFVTPGKPENSHLVKGLVGFGGPMLAVFSDAELDVMRRWIQSLPDEEDQATTSIASSFGDQQTARPMWSKKRFRQRSESRFGGCSVRELYHYLVNVEYFPDILPVAERFAQNRLARSMARLDAGERPIPSQTYSPDALEHWVHAKHREQIDSYRPLMGEPAVTREAFADGTVQLAPLILIDGGWLQNVANPSIIHTLVGRMLFRVFYEELGEGDPAAHHANVYRDLLAAMGENAPAVETMEFAQWTRLRDSSFDVPALWLSISCFPRHFMPEILGLNLAVELAGIGGPYMEARDTLRHFKLPTLFVELHNAADNVANGHAAQSMNAIKQYMDEVATREGPHNLDEAWHRVWSGVCATLPQIGALRWAAHRIRARLMGTQGTAIPQIFRA